MSQIITNAFSRYWQECLTNQTPVVLDEFVLANMPGLDPDAAINPDSGLPPAGQIVHRHVVDQRGRINNDAVAYTIVMDTTVGDFSFNAMYLINKATGVVGMIVHKGLETKLKTNEATGQTGNSLVKSMLMEYDRAAEATATHVDASTWQIDYAARLRGMDNDLRLQALQFFGPATFYGDGFKLVNESGVYKVQPGVAYVGGLRAELNEVKKVTPGAKPVGLWLDIYRAGSLLDAWVNHFTLALSVPDMVDYLDSNGHMHHVAKVAIVNADGSVTDVRRKRTIELTGDVTGKGILEDAQGVTIAVEIKDGSHRHQWGELDQVPATASRWPRYDEVTNKPDLAAAKHRHPWGDLDEVPELALKRHRHPWENLDGVPAGLGTYAAAVGDVATQMRDKSGFFNGSNVANQMPFGSEWKYYFNAAHGNSTGYNGVIGLDFSGTEMGFATVEGGKFKGWRKLWHSESALIQSKAATWPGFEMHIPGKHAGAMRLGEDGSIHWWQTDGVGGWASTLATLRPGSLEVNGSLWAANNSHSFADQYATLAPFHVDFAAVAGASDYYPIVRGKSVVTGQGYTTQVELGMLRSGGATWGTGVLLVRSGESAGAPHAAFQFDWGGNFYAPGGVHDMGQRVYSPNNPPHNSHNHTAAQGNQDIVASGWGQVGTYMMAAVIPGHAAAMNPSATIAGSSLRPANCSEWGQNRDWALPGTWKCLGFVSHNDDDRWDDRTTLWIRIA
ncbi:phage tail-collar fiber domain-containing protein [Aeromonas hydrophila]|uniref:phage tail-collar fiber domain-containing protein n=1 Tax=Aeromonas hydrophila TaxID=644 RepID=UPI0020CB354C|nr:phage tail protein [Aeromonas hydrophila]